MDIAFSSTEDLAAAISAVAVSATDALEAQLAQIDKHNPALNAVVTLDADTRAQTGDRGRQGDYARRMLGTTARRAVHIEGHA